MRRVLTFLAERIVVSIAMVIGVGALWLAHTRLAPSRPPLNIDMSAQLPEYTIHDGKVLDRLREVVQDKPDAPGTVESLDIAKAYGRAKGLLAQTKGKVFKATITPHWFDNNTRFWYRNDLKGGTKEFILVDATQGTRERAFDHQRLAEALTKAAGKNYQGDKLPFDSIEFVE